MAEGLKVMALEGHGIAFLPESAVRKEVRARTLVSALPPEIDRLDATMEIRAYRERPGTTASKSAGRVGKGAADSLWAYLVQAQGSG